MSEPTSGKSEVRLSRHASSAYGRDPFDSDPLPTFEFDIVVVGGDEGRQLRAEQARVTKEILQWVFNNRRKWDARDRS